MKIAVVGGRDFKNYPLLKSTLDVFVSPDIISGGAIGADSLARLYAKNNGLKMTEYFPDWNTNGKRAGFLRNELIIKDADIVVAFWDGRSKGTQHSINLATKHNKELHIIKY